MLLKLLYYRLEPEISSVHNCMLCSSVNGTEALNLNLRYILQMLVIRTVYLLLCILFALASFAVTLCSVRIHMTMNNLFKNIMAALV